MQTPPQKSAWKFGSIALLVGAAVVGLWMYSETASAQDPAAAGDDEVLARIGEIEIRTSDVEKAAANELQDLERQRHEILQKGLESAINNKLVEMGAAAAGQTRDEYLDAQVTAKIAEVTDADVDEFYEARKSQINQPKEAVASQIKQFLQQSRGQEGMQALIGRLREEHQPEVLLEPMRIEVASGDAPSLGSESAPVTIVEFSDFQCPFCSRVVPTLERVKKEYGDKVRLVFRQFPLHSIHPEAQKAAEASLCAHDQGKFWEMHDLMFEEQRTLAVADLKTKAAKLELDTTAFDECLDSGRYAERVNEDLEAGIAAGVTGTPAIFINGRFMSGAQPFDAIAKVIDDELRRAES